MHKYRFILFPFSLLYALITSIRNWLYDHRIILSTAFHKPIISVGNLRIGGTGKTPQIEYLIRLLKDEQHLAIISRGYKRKTKGFVLADKSATVASVGDEAFQIKQKFPDVVVAVSESRVEAVKNLSSEKDIDVFLLDDAFQHRKIQAGLQIVLTAYDAPFYQDRILPVGNLRESKKNIKRADIVLVTKCPESITLEERVRIAQKIKARFQGDIFFSSIRYDEKVYKKNTRISVDKLQKKTILLITGIANPQPLFDYLSEKNITFESLKFGDHHHFSSGDIKQIEDFYNRLPAKDKLIVTTEKDYGRLKDKLDLPLYYLPIQTKILDSELFNKKILDYVRKDK